MKEYYLFLDESKPNTNFQNFTLGGIAIEKEVYENQLKPLVNALKIWESCFWKTRSFRCWRYRLILMILIICTK